MFSRFLAVTCTAALSLAGSASISAADDVRVLRLAAGVCPEGKAELVQWAGTTKGYASFAVPVGINKITGTCGSAQPALPAAYSQGFDDKISADHAAKERCLMSLPEGYSDCAIVANGFSRAK